MQKRLFDLDRLLSELGSSLVHLTDLIGLEHEAVRTHNIVQIEEIGEAKLNVGQSIQTLTAALNEKMDSLFPASDGAKSPWTLTTIKEGIASLELGAKAAPLQQRLLDRIENCLSLFKAVKPEVEKNRVVLSRLLHNHQESYKFWQSLVTEAAASYDQSGTRRSVGAISQFSTRA